MKKDPETKKGGEVKKIDKTKKEELATWHKENDGLKARLRKNCIGRGVVERAVMNNKSICGTGSGRR